MSDKLPWFPFWIDKWETDPRVRVMGPVARSYYLILLMVQWREGHIPESRKSLQRLLTLPSDPLVSVPSISSQEHPESDFDLLDYEAILDQVLICFAPDGDGHLINAKLKSIRDEQLRVMEAKSRGGKHSSKSPQRVKQESSKTAGVEREKDLDLDLKKRGRQKSPPPSYSQDDFDERDMRKIAAARKKLDDRMGARIGGDGMTNGEYFGTVAEETGIPVKRVLALIERVKQWPKAMATA